LLMLALICKRVGIGISSWCKAMSLPKRHFYIDNSDKKAEYLAYTYLLN
jgi:hypothetical protein